MADSAGKDVLYAMLRAAARVGVEAGVPIKRASRWMRLAQFHELRKMGLTIAQASERLGVSEPTGARIARELRKDFLAGEVEHDLPRRIAFLLWPGPLSRKRIAQVLPHETPEDIDDAVATLLAEERIERVAGRGEVYGVTQSEDRLVRPAMSARLGGLNSLLDNLIKTIVARFFQQRGDAFARTISFRMRPEDQAELQAFYREQLWPLLANLEKRCEGQSDLVTTQLSILWVVDNEGENHESE
ncbi:MAG: Lrp/AsnC family transcriptional regulator [Myxococcota bacterium]